MNPFVETDIERSLRETPGTTFQERWPQGPTVADAYRMGGLAAMDQYRANDLPELVVFGAWDKARRQQEKDAARSAELERSAGVERLPGFKPINEQRAVEQFISDEVMPADVLGAATLFGGGRIPMAIAGTVLGSDVAQAAGLRGRGRGAGRAAGGVLNLSEDAAKGVENWRMGDLADQANYGALWQHMVDPSRAAPAATMQDIYNVSPIIKPGDARISTRFPTGARSTEDPLARHLSIGLDEMRVSPGFERNIAHVRQTPGFGFLRQYSNDEDAAKAYIDRMRSNMGWLFEQSPQVMRERSPRWYEGAQYISGALADRWGIPRPAASGGIASLSPQKDWFQNLSLTERAGDILTSAAAGRRATSEMMAYAKKAAEDKKFGADFWRSPEGIIGARRIEGKSLDQLTDPIDRAIWVRLYDEAHNPRHYRTITPEGQFGDWSLTSKGGVPERVAWGNSGEISKALRSLESGGDPRVLSPLMGYKHKVRSFYNNVENPYDIRFGDVTGDTHQVGAGQLRAVSQDTPAVQASLASGGSGYSSSDITGVQGTYGLIADATRGAARDLGLRPSQAQSGVWEPIRELFPKDWKTAKNVNAVDDVWRAHDRGELSLAEARSKILEIAGGIGTPAWARPGAASTDARRGSSYR